MDNGGTLFLSYGDWVYFYMTFNRKQSAHSARSVFINRLYLLNKFSNTFAPPSLNVLQNCQQLLRQHRMGTQPCFSFHLYSLQQSPEEAEEARGKRITGALIHIEYSSRGANEWARWGRDSSGTTERGWRLVIGRRSRPIRALAVFAQQQRGEPTERAVAPVRASGWRAH